MDLLTDPNFKNKYQKHKLRVKLWESDFMEKYGRKPNKNDIREADVSIREAYKMYWQLKTQALEKTLIDVTFTDDVQANVHTKSPRKQNTEVNSDSRKLQNNNAKKNAENIDPQNQNYQENTSLSDPDCKNVDGVWGDHLSKAQEQARKSKQNLLVGRSSSFQLSQNKFASSSFTKRNPRKSLSTPKIRLKTEDSQNKTPSTSEVSDVDVKDGFDMAEDVKPLFGDPVKITYSDSKSASQSISTVQQLIEGHTINRNLNAGWLDRCAKQNNVEYPVINSTKRLSGTSDSGLESIESNMCSPMEETPSSSACTSIHVSDEEDFICNSDSEEERKHKRIRNFNKRQGDQDFQASKRIRMDESDNDSSTLTSSSMEIPLTPHLILPQCANKMLISPEKCINISAHPDISNATCVIPTEIIESTDQNKNTTDENLTSADILKPEGVKSSDELTTKIVTEGKTGRLAPSRKIRRRIKQVSSDDDDDEDLDYTDKVNTVKKKTRRSSMTKKNVVDKEFSDENVRKPRTVKSSRMSARKKTMPNDIDEDTVGIIATRMPKKRSIAVKGTNIQIEKTIIAKPKKSQTKLTDLDHEDEQQNAADDVSELETKNIERPSAIYSVETLQTVPRYAMQQIASNDLVSAFSKSVSQPSNNAQNSLPLEKSKRLLSDKEKLEKKIADGKINENFVRINLKKKVFVRGKKHFNFSKFKKNQWKQRKKELASGEGGLDVADFVEKNGGAATCFKCGDVGHFSRYCPKSKGDDLLPLDEIDDSTQFPTLEEAQQMAEQNALIAHGSRIDRLPEKPSYLSKCEDEREEISPNEKAPEHEDLWEPIADEELLCAHKIPEDLVTKLLPPEKGFVEPLYTVDQETPSEVFETLRMFGHESFRPGQEKAVMRILSGQSTLVTLSTGSGKSLCYQLPAYLFASKQICITLVISPLVSLMDDQVTGIPAFLSAACLHTGQTPQVRENIVKMVKEGKVSVLLVSPEAIVAGEKSTGFGALLRQLPPIAFACIDEAHCISQWSHNFRPSYLMVCRVLRDKLRVKTILALTATATKTNAINIVKCLDIHDGLNGVISDTPMPKNLILTISKDDRRDEALVSLLRSERFAKCDSVIIYCTRREECARVAGLLRVNLQDLFAPEKPNVKVSSIAEPYHAGLSASRRKVVQKAFMGGQTRIIVATIAFGMGLNKPDIRAVIHYNMPSTFEGYVQEVGRAGRDGLPAHCHLFLSSTADTDKWELQRHIYATGVDRHTIRRLLQKVFIPCSCTKLREKNSSHRCPGHEVAIPINDTVLALDITEEMISTLLCYLELHSKKFITVLSSVYAKATVSSYSGPQGLKFAAQNSPPLAMAIAMDLQNGVSHEKSNIIEFPVVDVASAIGWDSGVVKSHLKSLEWKNVDGRFKRSPITVKYDTLAFRVKAPGDLSEEELDEALDALYARAQLQQDTALFQLLTISTAVHQFAAPAITYCLELSDDVLRKSEDLKNVIRDYFQSENGKTVDLKSLEKLSNEAQVAADVRSLILSYRDNNFTGRAVARIFHGIQSPNYPAYVWGKCRFWRLHLSCNFNALCQIATKEILALR